MTKPEPSAGAQGPFTVYVDDNFHYMDESERYRLGVYPTEAEAVAAATRIVDECLNGMYREGMSAEKLYELYVMFGEDPFLLPNSPFSAWKYAKTKCEEIAR